MRIQHNILAMGAYRNYTANTSAMQKNLERLSSGYKINRAGDDAAGLAISEKMRAQITGLETASKNAKDGISLVQTAEGALTEVHDMLNRMVELATQSANGTFAGDTDRTQLQKEVEQLKAEIDRIADSANFNGIQLLNGDMDTTTKVGNAIDISLKTYEDKGYFEILSDGQLASDPTAGQFRVDLSDFSGTVDGTLKVTIFGQELDLSKYLKSKDPVSDESLAKAIATVWNEMVKDNKINFAEGDTEPNGVAYGEGFIISAEQSMDGKSVIFTMSQAPETEWTTEFQFKIEGLEQNKAYEDDEGTQDPEHQYTNQGGSAKLTVLVEPVDSSSSRQYARARIDISALIDKIKDGATLTIGDTTYTFCVGRDSAYTNLNDIIDLTDLTTDSLAGEIGKITSRITTAAKDNKNFHVTTEGNIGAFGDGNVTNTYIYLTEKEGGVDTENYKLEGNPNDGPTADDEGNPLTPNRDGDWTGLIKVGMVDLSHMGNALTLQIGDTAESYNQLRVSINDCHVKSLGLSDVSVADQFSAGVAIDVIEEAINYVSDVRGTLGATQNRLDHTINNLSVMKENIQDAESTIRDTDVAEEMMAYTKNNILIQAAQAMLAQANQIPQGVLQLLQ